jgi:hypothetical protein
MDSLLHRCQKLRRLALLFFVGTLLLAAGCKQQTPEVDDPQLKPIQAIIDQAVPIGTSQASVEEFISGRGYTEQSGKAGTLVADIRHIDTQKLQPVTARVTFYFDANRKLITYEIVRIPNAPIPQ